MKEKDKIKEQIEELTDIVNQMDKLVDELSKKCLEMPKEFSSRCGCIISVITPILNVTDTNTFFARGVGSKYQISSCLLEAILLIKNKGE